MEEIDKTCIICSEDDVVAIGVVACDHGPYCYKCIFKMIVMSQNSSCPICKQPFGQVMITEDFSKKYSQCDFNRGLPFDKQNNIFADNKKILELTDSMNVLKCFEIGCPDDKIFPNLSLLEKHLETAHRQVLCKLCVENNMCVLNQQKLYTNAQLQRHIKRGDSDEDGNVYLLHPFCPFCKASYYDEDKFLKHLQDHFTCPLCDKTQQYRYYNNYQNLEQHFKMSHYLCDDNGCLELGFIAFATTTELELHRDAKHGTGEQRDKKVTKVDSITMQNLTGFYNDHTNQKTSESLIKDQEGIDMKNQLISQRPKQMYTNHIGDHVDERLDLRDFYVYKYNDQARNKEWQILQTEEDVIRKVQASQRRNPNSAPRQVDSSKAQEKIFLEDVPIYQIGQISYDYGPVKAKLGNLDKQLDKIMTGQMWDRYEDCLDKFTNKKSSIKSFFTEFVEILGEYFGYLLFPHFIAVYEEKQSLAQLLDENYYEGILRLPQRVKNLVNSSIIYSELFRQMTGEIEKSLICRIENKELDLKKKLKTQRDRIKQFVEILKRVSVQQMAQLKMAGNFGVSIDTIDLVIKNIYFMPFDKIQESLNKVPTDDIIHLYIYYMLCSCFLRGEKSFSGGKSSASNVLIRLFLKNYPEIAEKYYQNSKEEDSDEDFDFQETQNQQTFLVEHSQSDTRDFDTSNQFDFPSIVQNQNQPNQSQNQPQNRMISNQWEKDQPVIIDTDSQVSSKAKNQFIEEFPSIPEMVQQENNSKKDILERLEEERLKQAQKSHLYQAHNEFEEEEQQEMDEATKQQTQEFKAYGKKSRQNKKVYLIPGNFK